MAARDSNDPNIQFRELGGLEQRPSPNALPAPNFDLCHGVYQARAGAQSRLFGIEYCGCVGEVGETGFGAGIIAIHQTNDGSGNVIFQTADGGEYAATMNTLFHREVVNDLTYEPLPDDNDMPTATLIQSAANGTDVTDIGGSSANTVYTRPLTANPLNEDSIIVAFTSGASASFEIAPGTYRIRGYVTAAFTYTLSSGVGLNNVSGGFQAAISDTTNGVTVAIGSPANVTLQRPATSSTSNAGPINVQSVFDDTFEITGSNAVLQVKNAFSTAGSPAGSVAISGGVAADVTAAFNGAALTQPYVKLTLSKVA